MTAQGNGSQHTSILPVTSASGGTPRARKTSRSDLHPDHTRTPYFARPGERYSLNLGPEQSRAGGHSSGQIVASWHPAL